MHKNEQHTQTAPTSSPKKTLPPTSSQLKRWRQYLADERAEASAYRDLARRRSGTEKEILEALADAEGRHEAHWLTLLGEYAKKPRRAALRTRTLAFFARRFGSIFVLALAQRAEARSPYERDIDATDAMAADEQIHEEVIRALATHGRTRLSGTFRAAVFGANDGLVSNLALILGMSATGVSQEVVLTAGVAGLLAGALSMGAGEYVSVRSQRELLEASIPDPSAQGVIPHLDVNANELALVYRARGMDPEEANEHAATLIAAQRTFMPPNTAAVEVIDNPDAHEAIGTGFGAALSSFCFFASGAIIPVIPYAVGLGGILAVTIALVLVGLALLLTGTIVGVLSGGSPLHRALRQLCIGFGAAAVTYILGALLGAGGI